MATTGLVLDTLVGKVLNANEFSTVEVVPSSIPNQVNVSHADSGPWSTDTGEDYMSGGITPALTYDIVGVSTQDQVVAINVMNGSNVVTEIYGQVLNWNEEAILFQGYTSYQNGVLSGPLPGSQSTFIMDMNALSANGQPQDGTMSESAQPFRLRTTTLACFARGTEILTPSGAVAVEDLAEGDLVLTLSGQAQPVLRIGSSTQICRRHADPARVMPVQIQKNAFGPGLPVRDLFLSPEHALYHDGAMTPVHCLINGTTIRQVPVDAITYYHVELPQHDVIFAEGLPAESYLDTGNRLAAQMMKRQQAQAA